ncbi:alpha/beta fold hydrolase [Nocardia sp. NPDC004722]
MRMKNSWRRPLLMLAVTLAAVTPTVAVDTWIPRSAADVPANVSARPTIVLVHGAFADTTGWDADIAAFQRLGYDAVAVANPLRGLASDADYVRSVLRTIPGPIVLVGHSYGGAVITNAARGLPAVKALVYVGAFLPVAGESITTAVDPIRFPGALLGPATIDIRPRLDILNADVYIKTEDFPAVFAGDVAADEAARMAATQHPLALTAQLEPSGDPAWATVPSWDLITLDDKAIPPAGQWFMAQRAGSHIETVHSSHAVMVAHPDAVVGIVLDAIDGIG